MKGRVRGAIATLALCVAVLATATTTRAGTKAGQFAVEGAGRATCSAYTAARAAKSADEGRFLGFIEGYLTAANRYEPNTFDLSPWHSSQAFALILDSHCKANAKEPLVSAAQKMVVAMAPIRLADFSKLVEVGDAKSKAVLYETILKRAQSALQRRGLYQGQVDGKYNSDTRTAFVAFQKSANLNQSGVPDAATLWVLLNP